MTDNSILKQVRAIADYQFGRGAGKTLFSCDSEFILSSTGRIRQVLEEGERIATARAKDGFLTLSIKGAKRLHLFLEYPKLRVVVVDDAVPFVREGKNAFARHVLLVDPEIRAHAEVLLVDKDDTLLATGKAVLCACEMMSFERGVAVDVRTGIGAVEKT